MVRPRHDDPSRSAAATRRCRDRKSGKIIPFLKRGRSAGVRWKGPNHGTLYEYQKFGCRCDMCVKRYQESIPSKISRRAQRRATDPVYNIINGLRSRLACAMYRSNAGKSLDTICLLGCSMGRFMEYLKAHFKPGMTFANYGMWHIDHRKPCAAFDISQPNQQRQCFNWLNLQPLWAKDNMTKGSKYGQQ